MIHVQWTTDAQANALAGIERESLDSSFERRPLSAFEESRECKAICNIKVES